MNKIKTMVTAVLLLSLVFANVALANGQVEGNLNIGQKNPASSELPFTDTSDGAWYYDAVKYVFENNIMKGVNDTYFGAAENLARAQFAVVLYRMNGEPQVTYTPKFPDVTEGEWYTDAILWANSIGVVNGYSDTKMFGPADNINREQMATMMYRYAEYKRYDTNGKGTIRSFPDYNAVSSFSKEPVKWAVGMGIISGDQGKLNPQGSVNRAVCATIIQRFIYTCDENPPDYSAAKEVYGSILEEYRLAEENNFYHGDQSKMPNVNPELSASAGGNLNLCYSFIDIGDGAMPLLVIADCRETYKDGGYNIYDIYKYDMGTVQRVFDVYSMGYRTVYTICNENIIKVFGSGGAFNWGHTFYKMQGQTQTYEKVKEIEYDGWNGDKYYEINSAGSRNQITKQKYDSIINQYSVKVNILWYEL